MDSVVGPQRSSISAVDHAYGRTSGGGSVVRREGSGRHPRQRNHTTLINAAQWEAADAAGTTTTTTTGPTETTSLVTAKKAPPAPTTTTTTLVAELPAIIVTLMINFMTAIPVRNGGNSLFRLCVCVCDELMVYPCASSVLFLLTFFFRSRFTCCWIRILVRGRIFSLRLE